MAVRYMWAAIDLAIILLFVGIGRTTHDHGVSFTGLISTTWPFAVGWLLATTVIVTTGKLGASVGAGLLVWLTTVVVGMLVRVVVGQGIALAFVIVALGFLGVLMLGWRVLWRGVQGRRA